MLACISKARQGMELNWNITVQGDLLKLNQFQWDLSAHSLPGWIFMFLWSVTHSFFPPFFLILHDIMNQSLVATAVNLWCYVCVMNNAEVSWF